MLSIGIGGGSVLDVASSEISIGPVSVASKLLTQAKVIRLSLPIVLLRSKIFGGNSLTATDFGVVSGARSHLSHNILFAGSILLPGADPELARSELSEEVRSGIRATLRFEVSFWHLISHLSSQFSDMIDKLKTRAGAVDLIVVGGGNPPTFLLFSREGGFLVPDTLPGFHRVIRPKKYGDVANAIGAAISQVNVHYQSFIDVRSLLVSRQ